MAGKNIFIERILDNLLSGIDGALASMKAAMEKMIGGEDPAEQASLFDVVTKLDDVVGEDGKSLSDVTTALAENSAAIIGTGDKSLTDVTEALNTIVQDVSEKIDEQLEKLNDVINAIESGITEFTLIPGNNDIVNLNGSYIEKSSTHSGYSHHQEFSLNKTFKVLLKGQIDLYANAFIKTNYSYTPEEYVGLKLYDITTSSYVESVLSTQNLNARYRQTEYDADPATIFLKGATVEKEHEYRIDITIGFRSSPSYETPTTTAKVQALTIEYSRQTTGEPGGAIILYN